ncbi:ABC-type multidrug transport system permease subunit [Sporomusaceae bacterium BoRhaA]|uniref:ABC transporter permease n=1 Tax=Pelorhabdus rhamnosifermentans TaxID=2772457 RepID=UPI001C062FE9|nr:ABC transporter permease [Pelorhabdus rhamnosifermentans]MBU2702764.1 ABC-type multidrug transport system permease subunit [Pelorhabdus rhamnosifermentans]
MMRDIITVFWRDWLVLNRRLGRFILSRMVSPILYLVAFGWGLGSQIQVSQGSYLDYIVPGIVALNSMMISFNAVGTPVNMARLYHKTLEEYQIAPISAASFVFGKVLSGILRGLISSLVIILLAYVFGATLTVSLGFWLVLILNCALFAALGFVAAMFMNSHEEMANFNTYVLTPMSFLCATFFSADRLPPVMHELVGLLPLTHASQALRLAGAGHALPWFSVAVLVFYVSLFLIVSIWQMRQIRN